MPGRLGDFATFAAWLRQGQAINDALNDTATMAWSRISGSYLEPDPAQAIAMNDEALHLARQAGDHRNVGDILYNLGDRFHGAGDTARAEQHYRDSVAAFRLAGDHDIIAFPIGNLGRIASARGDTTTARGAFEESIAIARAANNIAAIADWHVQLTRVALRKGNHTPTWASQRDQAHICATQQSHYSCDIRLTAEQRGGLGRQISASSVWSAGKISDRSGESSWKICSGRLRFFRRCVPRSRRVVAGESCSRTSCSVASDMSESDH